MVELCSCLGNGDYGSPRSAVTGRVATSGYPRRHRHSLARAGSGKAGADTRRYLGRLKFPEGILSEIAMFVRRDKPA